MPTRKQAQIDRHAWPITIRIRVPDRGFASWGPGNDPHEFLRAEFGLSEYATTGLTTPLIADGLEIHLRSIDAARRFLDRFPQAELADGTESPIYNSPYLPGGR